MQNLGLFIIGLTLTILGGVFIGRPVNPDLATYTFTFACVNFGIYLSAIAIGSFALGVGIKGIIRDAINAATKK